MLGHRYQTLLGAVGVLAFVAVLGWIFFFDAIHLRPGVRLHVDFARLSILDTGSAVKIGALKVGVVEKIQLLPESGHVRVTLWLDARMAPHVYTNSRVYLESLSLIGERHVNIVLPEAREPLGRPVKDGDVLRGQDPSHLDNLLALLYDSLVFHLKFWREMAPLKRALDEQVAVLQAHGPWFEQTVEPRLRSLVRRAGEFPELQDWIHVGDRLPGTDLLAEFSRLLDDLEAASGRLKGIARSLEKDVQVWTRAPFPGRIRRLQERFERLETEFTEIEKEGRVLVAALAGPVGTLQAFIRDPSIYNDLRMMARRLKNAPLDLLFKRKEKRAVK